MFLRIGSPFSAMRSLLTAIPSTRSLASSSTTPEDFTINVTVQNRVAIITIDRPTKLNAMNPSMISALNTTLAELTSPRWCDRNHDVRTNTIGAAILTGGGDRAFIAGADISTIANADETEIRKFVRQGRELATVIEKFPMPIIAAINGFAFGLGLELAMACDLRYGNQDTIVGLPEIKRGLIPGCGGTQRLTRLVGEGRAKELIYTGKPMSALRAYDIGLLNGIYTKETLLPEVLTIAQDIAKFSPRALDAAKSSIGQGRDKFETGLFIEGEQFVDLTQSVWAQHTISAFLKKDPSSD